MNALIGYARVSTQAQSLNLQIDALLGAGVSTSSIFTDTTSGGTRGRTRPGFAAALASATPGSTLCVWRIDRLGRSMRDVLDTIASLQAREVTIKSLSDGIDPSNAQGRLTMQILLTLAEYERHLIQERVTAGLESARSRGVRIGRPPAGSDPLDRQKAHAAQEAMRGEGLSAGEAARLVGWSRSTLYRRLQMYGAA